MKGLTPGRIVHYILSDGTHRPAMIVHIWSQSEDGEPDHATVNLSVFTDHQNDYALPLAGADGLMWATSVSFDAAGIEPGTWHWIEPA